MKLKEIYRFLKPSFQNIFLDYKVDFKPRYGHGNPPHQTLYNIINEGRAGYSSLIDDALSYSDKISLIQDLKETKDNTLPAWNNDFLPGLDIVFIYAIISKYNPSKYIEVGSGNSTKVVYKAKKEQNLHTELTSIDPSPRAEIDELVDTVIRKPFEDVDISIVDQLQENDILFIDNSHRILPNSDAMVFFMEVLPRLKKGVIVHIHDIYLPYDYPQFMCDRAYSEQYGLAFFLLANPKKYKPLFPNYFVSEDAELSRQISPIWENKNLQNVERHGGSFWLQIGE